MENIDKAVLEQFQQVGRDLFDGQLLTTHAGNLSMRQSDRFLITRHQAMKAHLSQDDLVEVSLTVEPDKPGNASMEAFSHWRIYMETDRKAIIHAHPVNTIALSLRVDKIVPLDVEAGYLLGEVPVLPENISLDPGKRAEIVAKGLTENAIVVLKGHGTFATGDDLFEALHWTSALEAACTVINIDERF